MQFIIIRFKIFSLEKKRFFYPYRIIQASCSNGPLTTVDRVSEGKEEESFFYPGNFHSSINLQHGRMKLSTPDETWLNNV